MVANASAAAAAERVVAADASVYNSERSVQRTHFPVRLRPRSLLPDELRSPQRSVDIATRNTGL